MCHAALWNLIEKFSNRVHYFSTAIFSIWLSIWIFSIIKYRYGNFYHLTLNLIFYHQLVLSRKIFFSNLNNKKFKKQSSVIVEGTSSPSWLKSFEWFLMYEIHCWIQIHFPDSSWNYFQGLVSILIFSAQLSNNLKPLSEKRANIILQYLFKMLWVSYLKRIIFPDSYL